MNERFEELKRRAVAEADTSHIDFDNMSHTEIQMLGDIAVEEKFAELIVRECANVAADHEALDIYEEIREHFGVEE
jgi:hypothetical protein